MIGGVGIASDTNGRRGAVSGKRATPPAVFVGYLQAGAGVWL